jgi:3-methylfumaryl-CoA hydratase
LRRNQYQSDAVFVLPDAAQDYAAWIGRTEEKRDVVTAGPLDRLAAALDRDDPPFATADIIPPLAHWLYFLPSDRQSDIGPDGHAKRGGFLPPVHELPRRMWAGSRVSFPGDIRVGDAVYRRSTIISVTRKDGKSGPLVFVTVKHEIGRTGDPPAIIDEHDIVYRGPEGAGGAPEKAAKGSWRRTLVPDAVLLFRFSALTFNGHLIHYDRDYAVKKEGYPGLVVHGPLIATLLVDLIRRHAPQRRIETFAFRAVSPLFENNEMSLNAEPPEADGTMRLWAANAAGHLAVSAEARLARGDKP